MNCHDFLSAFETGGWLTRRRARRHAAQCHQCAEAYTAFTRLKQQLASPDAVSPRARQLWERSGGAPPACSAFRRIGIPLTACLVTACLSLFIVEKAFRSTPSRKGVTTPPDIVRVVEKGSAHSEPANGFVSSLLSGTSVEAIDSTSELSRLTSALDQLDKRIERLKERAVRRDAEREVALTLARLSRW